MDGIAPRVSLSFVSSTTIFQRHREPRRRVVTLNQQRVKRADRKRRGRGGGKRTGGQEKKNIAAVTAARTPANIFPTKIESGSIRAYVIGSLVRSCAREETDE